MEKLISRYNIRLQNVSTAITRYLFDEIVWTDRLICIKGSRGVGKTTLLLQHIILKREAKDKALYVSLDDIYFQANNLVDLAEEFYRNGGKYLYLDEVHKYKNWSIEIKNIYDVYADLQIIFTSSSLLEINKGDADLSRRTVSYELKGLSFREFLMLESDIKINAVQLEEITCNHVEIAREITQQIKVFPLFKKYLQYGYYPFYKEGEHSYYTRLNSIISLIIETDIPSVYSTEYKTIYKLKKLLYIIATSLPYTPNITKLSEKIETTSRSSTLLYLDYLEKSKLISGLKTSAKGNNIFVKPDKIYLENTNLMYAIGSLIQNEGTIRETFFYNQLSKNHQINTSKHADFLIDEKYTFEIGGKGKKTTQIKNIENGFIASDDLEIGMQNKIPIWLFGLVY